MMCFLTDKSVRTEKFSFKNYYEMISFLINKLLI